MGGLNQLLKIFCNIEQQIQDPAFLDQEALYSFAKRIIEENKQVFNQDLVYDKNTQAKALHLVGFLDSKVLVNATDSLSGIRDIVLSYNVGDSSVWINVPMALNTTSRFYEGTIPGHQANVIVKYRNNL
ncbi:MAG: hypothetical protein QXV82_09705 [Ignisphaera sp.]